MKKTTNELAEDIKMTIAALLIMDGATLEETTAMANKMLHDLDIDDQPAGLVIAKNSRALTYAAPIVGRYNYATECIDKGFEPGDDYMKVKEEIDTIINGIKWNEQNEEEGTTMTKKVYMGILNRELQKLNDQLAKTYGNGYVTIHDGATYDDIVDCEVSWASIGDVTPEEATGFAGQLMTAIAMAKGFIFNGWEVTFDKNEDEGEAWADLTEKIQEDMKDWEPEESPYWMLKHVDYDELTPEEQALIDEYEARHEDETRHEDEMYDPYWMLKYCDYDELTDEQKTVIDEYDARHEELTAAALEDDDYIELQEDEYADEWAPAPAWADYDTIDKIALMMMNDGEPAWRLRDRAAELQAWYDGAVEAAVMLGTTPPARVLTLMRNCHTLREAAAIIDMHAPIVPTITPEDALDVILPY